MIRTSVKLKATITLVFLLFNMGIALAHDDEDHKKKKKNPGTAQTEEMMSPEDERNANATAKRKVLLDDFPSLHPLVTHFPIVLLLLAALIQLTSLFVYREPFSWAALVIGIGGLAGAYTAGEYVHPHTSGLSESAQWVLEKHEQYADYTLWSAMVAVVLKIVSQFIMKRKMWLELVISIAFISSAYCVAEAGHFGAQLTHIEGVGPQGNFLELEEHEH